MKSTLLAAFAAPSIALASIGIGPGVSDDRAYGARIAQLTETEAAAHGAARFVRADLDGSGSLDADEYVSLVLVTAELSRLNGFVALAAGGRDEVVALPLDAPGALGVGERSRVEAVARGEFYAIAGSDGLMSASEHAEEAARRFAAADRDRSGVLSKRELEAFAGREALFSRPSA
ncbi:MAG: hypothetical protein HXY23_08685 [Parvularculaceae bacterium]|nr:hypothetical protein [Parvularculaceae bacterium]